MLAHVTLGVPGHPWAMEWHLSLTYLHRAIKVAPHCAQAYWKLRNMMLVRPDRHARQPYNARAVDEATRLCYKNRAHFNHFYYYYSRARIHNYVRMAKETMGYLRAGAKRKEGAEDADAASSAGLTLGFKYSTGTTTKYTFTRTGWIGIGPLENATQGTLVVATPSSGSQAPTTVYKYSPASTGAAAGIMWPPNVSPTPYGPGGGLYVDPQ
jgi:predicted cupin superfamily sugar epimerase